SNVFPDIVNAELPLDNQRAPGYRRIQPTFSGFIQDGGTGGFISQYPSGRYSKAHFHASGAVLVCLRGKGCTYNWPVDLGPTTWARRATCSASTRAVGPSCTTKRTASSARNTSGV